MISCKEYAKIKKEELKALNPNKSLSIIQVGDNAASQSYVRGKLKDCEEVGIDAKVYSFPESIGLEEFNLKVYKACQRVNGVLVTMPLPEHLDLFPETINSEQDIDGCFSDTYPSCTAEGIINWLDYNKINLQGTVITVIGRGKVVGLPLIHMLIERGATVIECNSHTDKEFLAHAINFSSVVVSAVGKHDYLHLESLPNIYNKTIVWTTRRLWIDVGVNLDENGKLCGDLPYEWLTYLGQDVTHVPGGVGLLTRVTLLNHLIHPEEYL